IWNSRIPDRVGHIPCEIRGLEDEIEATPMADDYFFFYPGVGTDYAFDVIDREHAEYDTCEGVDGSQVVWKVRKWVVLRKSIPEFDLFYADYNRWLANEMFKELCELHGITGVSFSPVEVN